MLNNNKFYEHAKIFDNYYGTLKKNVDENIKENQIKDQIQTEKEVSPINESETERVGRFKKDKLNDDA